MKLLILSLSFFTLFGCTTLSKPVVVEKRVANIPIYHPAMPDGIRWTELKWVVWTPKEMRKYLKQLDDGKAPRIALYWLSPKGYERLGGNMTEIIRVLKSNQKQFLYYRNLGKKNADQ